MHTVLIALLLLQIKHFIGDFVLQSARQSRFKSGYGHRAGLEHAGIHAVLTLPCLLGVGVALTSAVIAAAAEFVVHYHEDWLKERIIYRAGLTSGDQGYWLAFGADQLVHQLTYLAMIAVLL